MAIPTATTQAATNAVAGLGAHISLHTAAAGTTGASEASGGGYARQQTTWTASGGNNNGSQVTISVAAGTYVEAGIWSAATAGTFVGSSPFTGGNVTVSGSGASINVTPSIT